MRLESSYFRKQRFYLQGSIRQRFEVIASYRIASKSYINYTWRKKKKNSKENRKRRPNNAHGVGDIITQRYTRYIVSGAIECK